MQGLFIGPKITIWCGVLFFQEKHDAACMMCYATVFFFFFFLKQLQFAKNVNIFYYRMTCCIHLSCL